RVGGARSVRGGRHRVRRHRRRRAGADDPGRDRGLPGGPRVGTRPAHPGAGASIGSMDDWSTRRRDWEERRLRPALERSQERRPRFSTISDVDVERLYGPWSWRETADGEPSGGSGPTAVDQHGGSLGGGRW